MSFHCAISLKGGFLEVKMTFYYCRQISIFSKGLSHDSCKKNRNIFRAFFSVKETLVLSFDDVVYSKGRLFRGQKRHFSIVEKCAQFQRG